MPQQPLEEVLAPLLEATGAHIVGSGDVRKGDVEVRRESEVVHVRLAHLDGALERLIAMVERDLGAPLAELDRENKQRAVAHLHDLGAFNLRKSVEDVAAALGVSRFTVYNYLDRTVGDADADAATEDAAARR